MPEFVAEVESPITQLNMLKRDANEEVTRPL